MLSNEKRGLHLNPKGLTMKKIIFAIISIFPLSGFTAPQITGTQILLETETISWPKNLPATKPNLEGGANLVNDLNIRMNKCDFGISTAGNFNVPLAEYLNTVFLEKHKILRDHGNMFWTTSPPVSVAHAKSGQLTIGNVKIDCKPSIAMGPKGIMKKLKEQGLSVGDSYPIIRNYGNVLLVRKEERRVRSIWDLGDEDIMLVTSNLKTEPGSGGNYSNSIYNIALAEKGVEEAEELFNHIYNNDEDPGYSSWGPIMHRGVPQAIKNEDADVAIVFYHLALQYTRQFPGLFKIIPLGGTVKSPEPQEGNKVATMFIVRIKGNDDTNNYYANKLIEGLQSEEFTKILTKHGLRRPQ